MGQRPAQSGDTELVMAAREGDANAFGTLIERYQNLVYGASLAVLADPMAAQDVTQEAFIAAWRALGELREPERVRSWLAGIARNTARNHVRSRRREVLSAFEEGDAEEAGERLAPDDALAAAQERRELWEAVAAVPDRYREVLILFYREEQSIRQCARGLDLSEEAVKQRLSRGRKALREGMERRLAAEAQRARPRAGLVAAVVAAIAALPARKAAAAAGVAGGLALFAKGLLTMKGLIKIGAAAALLFLVLLVGTSLRADRGSSDNSTGTPSGRAGNTDSGTAAHARGQWSTPPGTTEAVELRGIVVNSEGTPIAGATVRARGDSYMLSETQHAVLTNAAGRFAASAQRGVTYHVAATAVGFRPATAYDQSTDEEIRIVLAEGGITVGGRVLDIAGGPIPGATVSYYPMGGGTVMSLDKPLYSALTDDDGRYQLTLVPGQYIAAAGHPDYANSQHGTAINVPGAFDSFTLIPGASISGVVRRRGDREPVPNATVYVSSVPDEFGRSALSNMLMVQGLVRTVRADSAGRFQIAGLAAGRARLAAEAPGMAMATPTEAVIDVAERRVDHTVWVEEGVSVRGRVVDASSREGIADAVIVINRLAFMTSGLATPVKTDEQGRFEAVLSAGGYDLVPMAGGTQFHISGTKLAVGSENIEGLELEVKRGAVIRGRLDPPESGMMLILPADMGEDSFSLPQLLAAAGTQGRVSDDGTFELSGAPTGPLGLMAQSEGGRRGTHKIEVTSSSDVIDGVVIKTHRTASVAGVVVDTRGRPLSGANIRLKDPRTSRVQGMDQLVDEMINSGSRTNPQGRFLVTHLRGNTPFEVSVDDVLGHPMKVVRERRIAIDDSSMKTGVRVVVAPNDGVIEGRVVSAEGQPLGDVAVTSKAGAGAMTDVDGVFRIESLPAGKYELKARHAASGASGTMAGVVPGQPVELRLDAPATLRVSVAGESRGLMVTAYDSENSSGTELPHTAESTWSSTRMRPGKTIVSALGVDSYGQTTVELQAGEHTETTLAVRPFGRVTGRVLFADRSPAASAGFVLERESPDSVAMGMEIFSLMQTTPDADGRFELKVVEGLATLQVSGSGATAKRQIDVAPGEVLDLGTIVLAAAPE